MSDHPEDDPKPKKLTRKEKEMQQLQDLLERMVASGVPRHRALMAIKEVLTARKKKRWY